MNEKPAYCLELQNTPKTFELYPVPKETPLQSFKSLHEARSSLEEVQARRMKEFKDVYMHKLKGLESTPPYPAFGTMKGQEQEAPGDSGQQLKDLSEWEKAYEPLYDSCRRGSDSQFQDATILMIKYHAIKLTAIPVKMERASYSCVQAIISLSKEVITPSSLLSPTAPVDFTGGLSIANELSLCIMRCRDEGLRKESMNLLYKHPRGLGMWDSLIIAKMAEVSLSSFISFIINSLRNVQIVTPFKLLNRL
jgi:hypothetical protein